MHTLQRDKDKDMSDIRIGERQTLTVLRSADFGIYLGPEHSEESVLLPKKQVPEGTKPGDKLSVFIYRDSEDRLIATTRTALVQVHQFAYLTVRSVARVGAFLDWGLEKDLFLPYKEQERTLKAGEQVLVYVYLDKSGRLSSTMRVYDWLSHVTGDEFAKDSVFSGIIYRVQPNIGAFTAVIEAGDEGRQSFDRLYYGLVPRQDLFENYKAGDRISGHVVHVRPDGKLDLAVRAKIPQQLEQDGEQILRKMEEFGGTLPFGEKASPEIIKRELHMSKSGFKRALGHLLKEGKIVTGDTEIRKA